MSEVLCVEEREGGEEHAPCRSGADGGRGRGTGGGATGWGGAKEACCGAGCRRRAVGRSCVLFSRAGGVEARRGEAEARCGGVSRGVASCVARLKST
jgi:hypothetical protein